MNEPRLELLYEMSVLLEPPQVVGQTPQGLRQIFYVRSGTFQGPRIRGEVLPGGGDWFLLRPDGVGELDVRATARTDDGALVYAFYRGYIVAAPEVWEQMRQGREVPRDQYYFYTTPMFQTAAPQYEWLNRTMAVGVGFVVPGGVAYRVFALV